MRPSIFILPVLLLSTSGCIAKTALDIVTLPVDIASKGVDLATTSQSEADEKRGRALRLRDEQIGKLDRKRLQLAEQCRDGDDEACDRAEKIEEQIQQLKDAPL